jgi:hypothetical protein
MRPELSQDPECVAARETMKQLGPSALDGVVDLLVPDAPTWNVPAGYENPRHEIIRLARGWACGAACFGRRPADWPDSDKPYLAAIALQRLKYRTYFLGRDLAAALLNTEPPDTASVIKYMPTSVFLLAIPEGCVAVAGAPVRTLLAQKMQYPAGEAGLCVSYFNPGDLLRADGGESDELTQAESSAIHTAVLLVSNAIAFMQARPTSVEVGTCARKANPAKGKREIWHPTWIGRTYKIVRTGAGGTHASPHAHWRRGHWRDQVCGPRDARTHKRIYIDSVLVGIDAEN